MMTERLLQFIWQFQYFNKKELETAAGESIVIVHPGSFNRHQGPDFLEAKIRIAGTLWIGNVELHVKAADWIKHAHHRDPNYENVILHVVWEGDEKDKSGEDIAGMPTLILQDRIFKLLLQQYERWMNSQEFIPCAANINQIPGLIRIAWQERLMMERIERKYKRAGEYLRQNNQHWEETFWIMIARNFGVHVNGDAFEEVAVNVPFVLLSKHRNQVHQLEAILLGQAGLLDDDGGNHYQQLLQKEYRFYAKKYGLQKNCMPALFLRMRPGTFPTIRLAQLAMLIHSCEKLFDSAREADNVSTLRKLLNVTASEFWHNHYTFDDRSVYRPKTLGTQMADNIIINTIVPILFAYARYRNDDALQQKAYGWLRALPAEKNSIATLFVKAGLDNNTAFDSQSYIELKTFYCDQRRCLDCTIGNALLKRSL